MTDRSAFTPDGSSGAPEPSRGPTVAGYDLLEELGRGSAGVVYKARHRALNRLVALKMVVAGAHAAPEQLARFAVEARAVAALHHPAIVQIHEIGESGGLPFLSLEYVDGPSLDRVLGGRPRDPREAVRLIGTLADAIDLAHHHGILHRDLKPANVLLTAGGTPKLTDFGLAKDLHEHSSQTRTGTLLGTPSYMAPEQARGDLATLGPAVDIHALGAILYEMLVGRPPFLGASPYETTMQVVNDEPVPPSRLVGRLPPDVETICLKCLQKDPAKRYRDAAALAEDCRRFIAGEPILSRPVSTSERIWRWCRRNPRVAALAASVAGLLVVIAAGSTSAAFLVDAWRRDAERAREDAIESRDLANRLRQESDRAFADAERQRIAAQESESRALKSEKLAIGQTELAFQTIQLLVDKVQTQLRDAPGTRALKADLLETALDGLQSIAGSMEADDASGAAAALGSTGKLALAARMRRGAIYREIGDGGKALQEYEISESIARRRAAAHPDNPAARGNLAAVLTALGQIHARHDRDMQAARGCLEEALGIWRDLESVASDPMRRVTASRNVAEACTELAALCGQIGDTAAVARLFEEAHRRRQDLAVANPGNPVLVADLARSSSAMAEMAFMAGDTDLARERYSGGVATLEALVAADPDNLRSRFELANAIGNFGELQVRAGAPGEARSLLERSLAIHRELSALDADDIDLQRSVGVDLYRLAVVDAGSGMAQAAADRNAECLAIWRRIVERDPDNDLHRIELMRSLARCGDHHGAAAMAAALAGGNPDPEVLLNIARCYAQCSVAAVDGSPELSDRYVEGAFAALEATIREGFIDDTSIRTDPDLAPLRGSPRFVALFPSPGGN